jgi:hypothetical protein
MHGHPLESRGFVLWDKDFQKSIEILRRVSLQHNRILVASTIRTIINKEHASEDFRMKRKMLLGKRVELILDLARGRGSETFYYQRTGACHVRERLQS